MTVKPDEFRLKVRRRPGKDQMVGIAPISGQAKTTGVAETRHNDQGGKAPKKLTILYGSNAGTSKAFAEELQTNAKDFGFIANVETLDHATEHLPTDGKVVIITPSYEGQPPDNGKKFVSWLESHKNDKILEGVNYTVFGLGNSDWSDTFHRIPKLVDNLLEGMGATRFADAGFCDAKKDIVGPWEEWSAKLWETLHGDEAAPVVVKELSLKVESPEHAVKLAGKEVSYAFVEKNEQLVGADIGSAKRLLQVRLPPGVSYNTGTGCSDI